MAGRLQRAVAEIPRAARLADDADWRGQAVDIGAVGVPGRRFSWLSPRTLWRSRNNVLVSLSGDPTEAARAAWVTQQRERLAAAGRPLEEVDDFLIRRDELERFSFMVIGDTGEGDLSQYAVVPAFLRCAEGTEFSVVASDVVYPAGDVNEYIEKFFVPFAGYPQPVFAIPGNHDWLDGLAGFMQHFCAAPPPRTKFAPPQRARWRRSARLLHELLWRRPRELREETFRRATELRPGPADGGPVQPNMYFQIDTPNLRIIALDLGILGRLDHEQGEWLARAAAGAKPKILISGKPIFAGASFSPRRILERDGEGRSGLLWSLLSDPANNFVAMISGDTHHYERHAVKLDDGRTLQCVISGGGGAFMTSTHDIPRVELPGVDESSWVVYPTRGDSLRAYSISLQRRLARLWPGVRARGPRGIPADEASVIVAERHGLDAADELARGEGAADASAVTVSRRSRILASLIFPRRNFPFAGKVSELLDWNDPPLMKNFVRVEVDEQGVELIAHGVTGLQRDLAEPAVIDRVRIPT